MTPEQQKEEISKAYLHAVAARCGLSVGSWSQDHGGVDTTLCSASPRGGRARAKIDVQLKCTAQQSLVHGDVLAWKLERAHYDVLRCEAANPHLLIVLQLPESENAWIEHSPECLILRRCAYWVLMTGMPEKVTDSVTVHLPLRQVFSPEQVELLMGKVSRGEAL